jgi:hypothetical protein
MSARNAQPEPVSGSRLLTLNTGVWKVAGQRGRVLGALSSAPNSAARYSRCCHNGARISHSGTRYGWVALLPSGAPKHANSATNALLETLNDDSRASKV